MLTQILLPGLHPGLHPGLKTRQVCLLQLPLHPHPKLHRGILKSPRNTHISRLRQRISRPA
jgi:hypothetical protein